MRDATLVVANGQATINEDSDGTISTDYLDLEQDSAGNVILTDDQIDCWCNVTITAYSYTSGGDEGVRFLAKTDDATDLATGELVVGSVDIALTEIAAGKTFSFRCRKDVAKRYFGGWVEAVDTAFVGTITFDMEFSDLPISANESLQKVTS